jgi:hypothetical protein
MPVAALDAPFAMSAGVIAAIDRQMTAKARPDLSPAQVFAATGACM